ncbi:MAG: BamA/TamA family outer membrane protein [Candidatus Eisenbacteria sp.]|nr:BamA/TamA family outer membrane protein [Candidatus Eisenbacteria bacterium]
MKNQTLIVAIILSLAPAADAPADPPTVREIRLEGSESFRQSTLTRLMKTRETSFSSRGRFDAEVFARDLDNLAAFYLLQGFLDVQVLSHPPAYSADSATVDLRITIAEGPQWRVSKVRLSGAVALSADTLAGRHLLREGGPYRPSLLPADRNAILDEYAARGYLDTRLKQDVIPDRKTRSVSIVYRITEGPPASVARVTIRGLRKTRRSTVIRELEFSPGDRFDLRRWGRSQSNLYNTGLFEWVWIQPSSDDTGKPEKEVLILVNEKPRWEFSTGVGYGRFDQARLVASIRQGNLLGRGIRGGLEGKISDKTRRAEFLISDPWFFGHRITSHGAAVYQWRDEPEFIAETVEGVVLLTRALRTRVFVEGGYRLRRTTLLEVSSSAADRDRRNRTSLLGTAISWNMRDDLFNTTRGFFLRFEAQYAGTFLSGTNQFLRANVYWRHFVPLPTGVILAFRSHLGAMTPLHTGGTIPINERYFMGGDQSVRGYSRHSLGPTDASGVARGGRKLVEFSQEFRIPVSPRFLIAVFADEGILFDNNPHRDDWAVGAGGGFRIVTPFGVVRVEAARGVTERWGTETEYYFSVGQSF